MALSKAKKARLEKKRREDYVKSVSITGNTYNPFMDTHWNDAARRYIETGDESLKTLFPSRNLRNWEVGK